MIDVDRVARVRRYVARVVVPLVLLLWMEAAIGIIDISTGPDFGMSLFYLVPVSLAGYWLGRLAGVIIACVGATAWLIADLRTTSYLPEVSVWNAFSRLIIFNGFALLLAYFRRRGDSLERSMAELHAEHSRQTALMAALRDPIVVTDREGVVTSANERASDLFGPLPIAGRRVTDLMPFTGTEMRPGRGRWIGSVTDPFGGNVELEVVRARLSGRGG